jgi:hypothetical protein
MQSSAQVATAARHVPPNPTALTPASDIVPIAWLGSVEDEDHILVLGGPGPELMCALLRAGASNVTHLRACERTEANSVSMIVVPRIPSLDWLATVLPSLRRTLTARGRIVLIADGQRMTQIQIRRMLTLQGLSAIRARPTSDGQVVIAERPIRQSA